MSWSEHQRGQFDVKNPTDIRTWKYDRADGGKKERRGILLRLRADETLFP
jgi:hypothetical protein